MNELFRGKSRLCETETRSREIQGLLPLRRTAIPRSDSFMAAGGFRGHGEPRLRPRGRCRRNGYVFFETEAPEFRSDCRNPFDVCRVRGRRLSRMNGRFGRWPYQGSGRPERHVSARGRRGNLRTRAVRRHRGFLIRRPQSRVLRIRDGGKMNC